MIKGSRHPVTVTFFITVRHSMRISANCDIVHFANTGCSAIGTVRLWSNDPQVWSSYTTGTLVIIKKIPPPPQKNKINLQTMYI